MTTQPSPSAAPFWAVKGRQVVALGGEPIATAATYDDAVAIAAEHNSVVLGVGADVQPLLDLLKEGAVHAELT